MQDRALAQGLGKRPRGIALAPTSRMSGVSTSRNAANVDALAGLRVLVVEDDGYPRDLLAALLTAEGAMVAQAGTGCEALALFALRAFDVVLTDLGLPDCMGDLLVQQFLLTAVAPVRIAVMTGHGEPHLARARAAGAHVIFQKPIEWQQLVTYLRRSSRLQAA